MKISFFIVKSYNINIAKQYLELKHIFSYINLSDKVTKPSYPDANETYYVNEHNSYLVNYELGISAFVLSLININFTSANTVIFLLIFINYVFAAFCFYNENLAFEKHQANTLNSIRLCVFFFPKIIKMFIV